MPIKVVVPLDAAETACVAEALGARPARAFKVEAGARWIVAAFGDPASLGAMAPDQARVRRLSEATGTFGISVHALSPDPDATIEVHSFGPLIGVDGDAVCGSGNACVVAAIARAPRRRSLTRPHTGGIAGGGAACRSAHLGPPGW